MNNTQARFLALFEKTGKIVTGDRFVGRQNEIRTILQTTINNRGHIAITGLPRIGKSSLAWEALISRKEEIIATNKLFPVYADVGSCSSNLDFFHTLILKAVKEIRATLRVESERTSKLREASKDIYSIAEEISSCSIQDIKYSFQDFFEVLNLNAGYGIIYILDEFDKSESILNKGDLLLLRETAYVPETNLSYVVVSRKAIKEIEAKDSSLSNFYGTFNPPIHLKPFDEDDLTCFWDRLSNNGLEVDAKIKRNISYIAGNHPMFLDLCCQSYLEHPDADLLDDRDLLERLYDEFEQLLDILKDKGLLDDVIQIVIGPAKSINKVSVDRLIDYGFLREVTVAYKSDLLNRSYPGIREDDVTYILFSDYFTQLFYAKFYLQIDYWAEWTNTENKLRDIVEFFAKNRYGISWQSIIEVENQNDSDWLTRWRKMKSIYATNQRVYYNANISSPVSFAETGEIYYQFIKRYWNCWFATIFTDITDNDLPQSHINISSVSAQWETVFEYLMKVRRPYAHTNNYILSEEDENQAKDYCALILNKIKHWENAGRPLPPVYSPGSRQAIMCHGVFKAGRDGRSDSVEFSENGRTFYYKAEHCITDGLRDGDRVVFDKRDRAHPYESGKKFYYAVNIEIESI